jgi:hypothetical protein
MNHSRNYRLNREKAQELFSRLPSHTTFGDIINTFGRIENPKEISMDELIVEINLTTEERLKNTQG